MKKHFTCIICPNGCEIEAQVDHGTIQSITGHTCPRGEEYVRQELTAPKRTIASSVRVENGVLPLASVRLTSPIPKEMIFPVMDQIRGVVLQAPVQAGTLVLQDVCGTGSHVMVTKHVPAKA